ncbi:MAG TPA: hypothetical protein PK230_12045, partial [Chitinophagales bacterium]|nr:hypothetical protein [Chitinophagales bacterium]
LTEPRVAAAEPSLSSIGDADDARGLPSPPLSQLSADAGSVTVLPTRLDQRATDVAVARLRDAPSSRLVRARVLRGHHAQVRRQLPWIVEALDAVVAWSYNLQKTNEKGVYDLQVVAQIVDKWYLYSQNNEGDAPFATQFSFDNDPNIEWLDEGKVAEKGTLIATLDPVFGKNTQRYAQEVVFSRRVKFNENVALSGKVSFMAADDMHYNMPREQTFSVNNDLSVVPATRPITAASWIIGLLVLVGIVATFLLQRKSKFA